MQAPPRLVYVVPVLVVAACTAVRLALDPWLDDRAPFILYIFGIMLSAGVGGLGPGLFATALAIMACHYFITEPRYTLFSSALPHESLTLVLNALAGVFISILCHILRVSEQSYRSLAEGLPHTVWEADARGVMRYQSRPWYEYTTAGADNPHGESWLDYCHPDDCAHVKAEWEAALQSEGAHPYDVEARLRRHDGAYRWFRIKGVPVRSRTGASAIIKWVGVNVDIHDLRQMEQDLRRSREMLRNVLDTVPVRVFWKDTNSVFLGCNRPFAQDAGRQSPDEVIGKTDFDLGWHSEAHRYRADDREVIETGQPKLGYEESQTRPDGRQLWLRTSKSPLRDLDGKAVGVLGTYEDITHSKISAQRAAEHAAELSRLYATAPVGLFSFDAQLRFVRANQMLAELNGMPADQHIGRTMRDVLSPGLADEAEPLLRQTMASGNPVLDQEVHGATIPRPHEQRDWLVSYFPVRGDDGRISGVHGVVQDITRRKAAEQLLAAAKLAAEQAKAAAEDANQAKDRFLAVLSHELRTPLTPVLAGVAMLEADPHLDADSRDLLGLMRRNIELEAQLIDDLLDTTRLARGKIELNRQRIRLDDVLLRVVSTCRADIDARALQLTVDLGPHAPYLLDADEMRLQQVFWNLLRNAIKFTPHGGRIDIRCRLSDPSHAMTEFTDNGMGIEADALHRIFNAFEQGERAVTRQYGGLGLGLAICKSLVEIHGGTIQAFSEGRSKGATFRVTLPIIAAGAHNIAMQTPGLATASSAAATPATCRILLVEDHGDTARLMKRLLQSAGHTVTTAADVSSALDLATTEPFDLLISDLGLPDGSGADLMSALRARGCTIPGIALSGFGQEEDVHRSREAGFAIHLIKPTTLARLKEAVAAALQTARHTPIP